MRVTNIFIILIMTCFMSITICEILLNCILDKYVQFIVCQLQLNKTGKHNYSCDLSQVIYSVLGNS